MKQSIVTTGLILSLLAPMSAKAVTWGDFLRGHWLTECKRSTKGRYTQTGYTFSDFSGPEFQLVMQGTAEFYDSKCTKIFSYAQNLGTLVLKSLVGSQPPLDAPKGGAKIRWQLNPLIQYPYATYDKKGVKDLNDKIYCGRTDWEVGKAKDLLRTNCEKEIRDYYSASWFFLEVTDKDNIRLMDKLGGQEQIHRWAFELPFKKPVR